MILYTFPNFKQNPGLPYLTLNINAKVDGYDTLYLKTNVNKITGEETWTIHSQDDAILQEEYSQTQLEKIKQAVFSNIKYCKILYETLDDGSLNYYIHYTLKKDNEKTRENLKLLLSSTNIKDICPENITLRELQRIFKA